MIKNAVRMMVEEVCREKGYTLLSMEESLVQKSTYKYLGLLLQVKELGQTPLWNLNVLNSAADDKLKSIIEAGFREAEEIDMSEMVQQIKNPEYIKEHVLPYVISTEGNPEFLETHPHIAIGDTDLRYVFAVTKYTQKGRLAYHVNSLEEIGLSLNELRDYALKNMRSKVTKRPLMDVLFADFMQIFGLPEIPAPFSDDKIVLSIEGDIGGACAILDDEVMDDLVEQYGEDFIIIPASTHEVVCASGREDIESLQALVMNTNDKCVREEDFLSNHVYRYNSKRGIYAA